VLLEDAAAAQAFPVGDLALAHCPTCGLLFNDAFDPAQVDYAEGYEETQGCSGTFSAWLEGITRNLIERVELQGGDVVEVGCGRLSVADFGALLGAARRTPAVVTAPAAGLSLDAVFYDDDHAVSVLRDAARSGGGAPQAREIPGWPSVDVGHKYVS